jgi:cytochrome oxidase Cu insertion factor (SCO1/SenC/PrrC family)
MSLSFKSNSFPRGVVAIVAAILTTASLWVFLNRETLAAACLSTVNGISSKMAHLSQPFGSGTVVQPKNPVLGIVPDFALTERSGRIVERDDLLGSYWVASFIFTRCVSSCPMVVGELTQLQEELPEEVRIVSFSVDPDHDSPEVLSSYAEKIGADPDRWLFLTGEKETIYKQVREGFRLAVQEEAGAEPGWEVTHSPRFALVDPKGRVRGYYESSDPAERVRLRQDVERLLGYNRTEG